MKLVNIIFTVDKEDFFTCKNIKISNKAYDSFLSDVKAYDVSTYLFVPTVWDFWDDPTKMLIPNYIKRKKEIFLKTHDEIINWNYFICSDKHSNIVLVIKYFNNQTEEDRRIVSLFANAPKIRLELVSDK